MEIDENLTRYTFLCEQDIRNIVAKLAKEMYKKHENHVESVCMWVQENPNIFLYYQEIGTKVGGKLSKSNVPFTIEI